MAEAESSSLSRRCHRELTALALIFSAVETASGRAWPISASRRRRTGSSPRGRRRDLEAGLRRRLAGAGPPAPIVVLIHGYKFHPALARLRPAPLALRLPPGTDRWKVRSWPEGLGFADDRGETGLCIGFGWPAARRAPAEPASHRQERLRPGLRPRRRLRRAARRAGDAAAAPGAGAPDRPDGAFPRGAGGAGGAAAARRGPGPGDPARGGGVRRPRARVPRRRAGAAAAAASTTSPPAPTTSTTSPSSASRRGAGAASGRWGSGSRARPPLLARPAARPRRTSPPGRTRTACRSPPRARGSATGASTPADGALGLYQAILRRRPGWDIASLARRPVLRGAGAALEPPAAAAGLALGPELGPEIEIGGSLEGA